MDDSTFDTDIELNGDGVVTSISYSYYDEQNDHHTETVKYSADPFTTVTEDVQEIFESFPELQKAENCVPGTRKDKEVVLGEAAVESTLVRGDRLSEDILDRVLAPSTLKQYSYAIEKWRKFCSENQLSSMPADPRQVASCVALCITETGSVSAADTLAASIAYEHVRNSFPSPTTDPRFRLLMRSIRKNFSKERNPATPLTLPHLQLMLDHLLRTDKHGLNGQLASLTLWRTVWRISMEFYTLGRFSDVSALTRSSLVFRSKPKPHIIVKFVGGKTDIYREGCERLVPSHPGENELFLITKATQTLHDGDCEQAI